LPSNTDVFLCTSGLEYYRSVVYGKLSISGYDPVQPAADVDEGYFLYSGGNLQTLVDKPFAADIGLTLDYNANDSLSGFFVNQLTGFANLSEPETSKVVQILPDAVFRQIETGQQTIKVASIVSLVPSHDIDWKPPNLYIFDKLTLELVSTLTPYFSGSTPIAYQIGDVDVDFTLYTGFYLLDSSGFPDGFYADVCRIAFDCGYQDTVYGAAAGRLGVPATNDDLLVISHQLSFIAEAIRNISGNDELLREVPGAIVDSGGIEGTVDQIEQAKQSYDTPVVMPTSIPSPSVGFGMMSLFFTNYSWFFLLVAGLVVILIIIKKAVG
jgi:hypothetical protein